MTLYDSEYKKLNNRIGAVLLIFLGFFNLFSVIYSAFELFEGEKGYYIFTELLWYAMYMASFMLPVLFFYIISKSKGYKPEMMLGVKFSAKLLLYIPAVLGLNIVASYINSVMVAPFGVYEYLESIQPAVITNYKLYDFVLEVIGTAMVPAFCEEFLFRGLILTCLLPYGKKPAIFISAITFALMHQNPAQIFYTFIAGLMLGSIAAETGSVWNGIILHFLNNLLSVVQSALYNIMPEVGADLVNNIITLVLIILGAVACIILVVGYIRRSKEKSTPTEKQCVPDVNDGIFGISIPLRSEEKGNPTLSRGYAVKGFFAAFMIAYVAICLAMNLLILLISAVLY